MSRFVAAAVFLLALAAVALVALVVVVAPGTILRDEPSGFLGPTPQTGEVALISIKQGDGAKAIAERLENAGVIQSARLFRVLVTFMDIEDELVAGDYEFDKGMTTLSVIGRIHNGITAPVMVTIPEGLRLEEIGALLEEKGVVSASDFLAATKKDYDFPFLADLPSDVGLEGYLFPATYGFSRTVTAEEVVRQMLTAFGDKVVPEVPAPAEPGGLTLHRVVTLASIVEREAVKPEERPLIASVFLNRMKVGISLQADPTVQYALGNDKESVSRYGYWKKALSTADLAVESPYNTYQNVGLPPGPIAGPGLDSIRAVVRPARTNYLFFVAKNDGSHVFAETLEEHLRNVEQYQH
jgi:UPF0755 protein